MSPPAAACCSQPGSRSLPRSAGWSSASSSSAPTCGCSCRRRGRRRSDWCWRRSARARRRACCCSRSAGRPRGGGRNLARARRRLRASPSSAGWPTAKADLEAIPERLLAYRYLLSPTLDAVRFDEVVPAVATRRAPARPGVACRGVSRAVAAARSDARAAEARRVVAARHDSRNRCSTSGSTRGPAGPARRRDARRGLRPAGPARRRRCAAGSVRTGPRTDARARARGERSRGLLGAHEGAHAAGGAVARRARHVGMVSCCSSPTAACPCWCSACCRW